MFALVTFASLSFILYLSSSSLFFLFSSLVLFLLQIVLPFVFNMTLARENLCFFLSFSLFPSFSFHLIL